MTKKENSKKPAIEVTIPQFVIKHPLLWLVLVALVLYLPTLSMGLTDLDDGIFINTKSDYNEDLRDLYLCFGRTIFGVQADVLYRPIISVVTILNYHLADHGNNIAAFHFVNIIFHITAVLLLNVFLIKIGIKQLHAFILSMVFAVHPVLTEAVAWVSARIEPILCISTLAFFIKSIDYANHGKIRDLLFSLLFLSLAFFTKETAVVIPPTCFILLVVVLQKDCRTRRSIIQYGTWAACYVFWYLARSLAISDHQQMSFDGVAHGIPYRMLTVVQYLGKIFLPFNLSVFPLQEDTVYFYGIIAILLLVILLSLYKKRDLKMMIGGVSIFILFLLPTFIIPKNINVQIFEYRLYIPIVGILMLMSQTPLLQNKLGDKQLLMRSVVVCCVLAVLNFIYQKNFADPLSFWTQAERTSPHSAYAKMMLSARVADTARSDELFLMAYQLDPHERMLNYIYGVRLQNKDSILESEKFLLAEKKISGYYGCDYYLARVAMTKKDYQSAIGYLENYLMNDSKNTIANNNLLLLYLDTDQDNKAKEQAKKMKEEGLDVPEAVLKHFNL